MNYFVVKRFIVNELREYFLLKLKMHYNYIAIIHYDYSSVIHETPIIHNS
jgi:hypothetical protein